MSARSSVYEKRIVLTKPFQASQRWHQLSIYENKILVQNCLHNEWTLFTHHLKCGKQNPNALKRKTYIFLFCECSQIKKCVGFSYYATQLCSNSTHPSNLGIKCNNANAALKNNFRSVGLFNLIKRWLMEGHKKYRERIVS